MRSWALNKAGLSLMSLTEVLPETVRYSSQATLPPGNDDLWHDIFTPYLKKIPNLFLNGLCKYNTDGPIDICSHLCYDGPKLKQRGVALAKYTSYGAWEGEEDADTYAAGPVMYALNTPSRRSRIFVGWDPHQFEPDIHIHSYGKRLFGKQAAIHFQHAMKDIWKITDAMVFRPEWLSRDKKGNRRARTGQLHFYNFHPWKGTPYGVGGVTQPKEFAQISPNDIEKFRKRLDISNEVHIAELAEMELQKALKCQPKNEDVLKSYLKAAKMTTKLAKTWRSYHLGLLYYNAAENTPEPSLSIQYHDMAVRLMTEARDYMWQYRDGFFDIYPEIRNKSKYRGKHPKAYLALVTQEVQNGYHGVVLAPKLKKYIPIWRLSSYKITVPEYKGPSAKPSVPAKILKVSDIADGQLPSLISLNTLPELNLTFEADLTKGGLIEIAQRPWFDRSARDPVIPYKGGYFNFGIADVDVLFDNKIVGQIKEYSELYTETVSYCQVRYIQLSPTTNKGIHTLTLRAKGRTGMELKRITLYAKSGSLWIKQPENFINKFDADPQWQVDVAPEARSEMRYDQKQGTLNFDIWREKAGLAVFYKKLQKSQSDPICYEFDFMVDSSVRSATAEIGLFGQLFKKKCTLLLSGRNSSTFDAVILLLLYPEKPKLKPLILPLDRHLKIGQWYHLKVQRINDILTVVLTNLKDHRTKYIERTLEYERECGWERFGVMNKYHAKKTVGPLKIIIDNVNVNYTIEKRAKGSFYEQH